MPFEKGKSGNPARQFKEGNPGGGRPKKRPITDRYHEGLEAPLEDNIRLALGLPEGATNGDAVAKAQIRAAIKGKTYAARELREATEGKATERLEIVGEGGGAIKIDIAESLARIREFYGLANPGPAAAAEKPDGALPVPAQVDRGQKSPKDRGKE
jgi:hypothetical protein